MPATQQTILYIEDDPASRMLVDRTLRHAGFNVVVAESGLEGIDLARKVEPQLILTDLNLPDLSGREVSTILRCDDRFAQVPIVALTAQGYEHRETSLAAGINGYLTKPLDVEALPDQIRYYLDGGQDFIEEEELSAAQLRYTREVVGRLEKRIRDLQSANNELKRLDHLKDTFIQLTAHELRTPLTLVFGYSRLLTDHPPLQKLIQYDENIANLVRGLGDAIERMQGLIEELLTMSRIMTNQIELTLGPTNLGMLVRKVIHHYEHALKERGIKVYFDQNQWPSTMRSDGELLKLALSNLLSNAIKYTPDGGEIFIRAESDAHHVRFSIRDTGIGIKAEDIEHIFERFHTVEDMSTHSTSKTAFTGGGLGLGLPICRGIITAHGGKVWVESPGFDPELFPGSAFFVELPLTSQPISKKSKKIKRLG